MAKLVGIRERLDQTLWDTVFYADGPCKIEARENLFSTYDNVGKTARSNMELAGCLGSDQSFVIRSAPTLVSFDNEKLYAVAGRDVQMQLIVGNKNIFCERLPFTMVREDQPYKALPAEDVATQYEKMVETIKKHDVSEKQHWMIMDALHASMPGRLEIPVRIPTRQMFSVAVSFYRGAAEIIGESGGFKSMVQCLRGQLTRDVL